MKILDCNLSYGISIDGIPYRNCNTFAELCDKMKSAGMDGGLIRCSLTSTAGVVFGNQRLADDLAAAKDCGLQLWGVWGLVPPHTGETPAPEKLAEEMAKNNIAALYLDPGAHHFMTNKVSMGKYFAVAQERRIPIILSNRFGVSVEQICDILENFPKLTVILYTTDSWPNGRRLYPIAAEFENVYVDMSYIMDDQGVEDLCKRFGEDHVLFGSAFPDRYVGSQMANVRTAMISEDVRAKVFGGNLERLIGMEDLK